MIGTQEKSTQSSILHKALAVELDPKDLETVAGGMTTMYYWTGSCGGVGADYGRDND